MDKIKELLKVLCYLALFVILCLVIYRLVYQFFILPRDVVNTLPDVIEFFQDLDI